MMGEFTFKEIAKAGTLFLVMGCVIWFQRADYIELSSKLEVYRKETKMCSEEYQKALTNQLGNSRAAIEKADASINKNNELLIKYFQRKWKF